MKKIILGRINVNIIVMRLIYKYLAIQEKQDIYSKIRRFHIQRKLFYKYHIILGRHCKIGKNLSLPHPQNIIIGNYVEIGDNCKIFQDVTLGLKETDGKSNPEYYPIVGDNCVICAGAKVLGNIKIQNNAVIAANAVVTENVENYSLYAGIPAKLKKRYGQDNG